MRAKTMISWTIVALLLGAWFAFLRPSFLGGTTGYVIVSGASMQPEMQTGDLVITTREDGYEHGDVVAFRVPEGEAAAGSMVIHRVVGGNGTDGYVTQGDNRELADQWRPTANDVEGSSRLLIPKAGVLIAFLRTPLGIALTAGLLVFLIVFLDRSPSRQVLEQQAVDRLKELTYGSNGNGRAGDPVEPLDRAHARRVSQLRHKL